MPYTEDTLVQQTTAEYLQRELDWVLSMSATMKPSGRAACWTVAQ